MSAALIVSVSGIGESNLASCVEFATELDARLVPASWLLPPRPRDGRHLPDAPAIRWLRQRVEAGDALVLHGFDHTVNPTGAGRAISGVALIGRRAEFAALPSHEATLRLTAAARVMDELGLPSDVFAPPRWLASAGTLVALRRRGFRVCADSTSVRLLDRRGHDQVLRGRVLHAGPASRGGSAGAVRGASADATEGWRHRALVASAARAARRGGLVRVAAEAAELARPASQRAVLDAVDAALDAGAIPASYRVPVPAPTPISA